MICRRSPRKVNQRSSEQAIHKAVISHLRTRAAPGVVFWHTPNGGFRTPVEGSIFKGMGVIPGIPDILLLRDGDLFGLELKAVGGCLSENQIACQCALQAAGAFVWTAYGLDEAIKTLEVWGLLRGTASVRAA
jgi:hypothetical protein